MTPPLIRSARMLTFTLTVIGALCATAQTTSAADIDVEATIQAVTVFPTGAEITRDFSVDLEPGAHVLKVMLPPSIQDDSVQIEATSQRTVSIQSLDLRPAPLDTRARDARDDVLRSEIAELEADVLRHTQAVRNASLARELLEILAMRQLQPQGPETAPPIPEASELTSLLDMVDTRLSLISETLLKAEAKIEDARQEIMEREVRLAEPREPKEADMLASIRVVARGTGSVSFRLRYRSGDASWQPVYEARLSTGQADKDARLEIVRNASVTQETGEDWTDVKLIISTARRTSRITRPTLKPQSVAGFVRETRKAQSAKGGAAISVHPSEKNATEWTPTEPTQTTAESPGFNVLFEIPDRLSIESGGNPQSVRIAANAMPADLSLAASPGIELTAYLLARFVFNGEAPLLPGRVMLLRDGVFVGEARLPLVAPGEALQLGFGADDLVRIERHELSSQSGESGLVSSAYIEERSYLIRATSRHSFPISITIEDQTPVTDDQRIRVEYLPRTTRPDIENAGGISGVLAWTRTLEPGEPEEIRFGFRVTWPKGISR